MDVFVRFETCIWQPLEWDRQANAMVVETLLQVLHVTAHYETKEEIGNAVSRSGSGARGGQGGIILSHAKPSACKQRTDLGLVKAGGMGKFQCSGLFNVLKKLGEQFR